MKRPSFQFYPSDWRKDMALQSCSVAARGLWIDMLCIAHECAPYGHLTVNGKPMKPAQIGRHTGLTERECAKLVAELLDAGVVSRSADGSLFSRRMVRDEDLRNRRAEGGKAGAEHGIKGAEHGAKGGRPAAGRGVSEPPLEPPLAAKTEPPLKPPPSSSSSSSSSEENGGIPPEPPARRRARPDPAHDPLPPWVDATAWDGWETMRRAIRKPLTPAARRLAVAELARLRDAGHDPTEVLRQSTFRSWAGLFPLRPDAAPTNGGGHHAVTSMSPHGMQTMVNAKALKARLLERQGEANAD